MLWVAGVIVLQGPADQPDTDAAPAVALAFFKEHHGAILLGTFLYMLGTLFFLWFLGLVRAQLGPAEGGARRVSSIAYAAGVAVAITHSCRPSTRPARSTAHPQMRRSTSGSSDVLLRG